MVVNGLDLLLSDIVRGKREEVGGEFERRVDDQEENQKRTLLVLKIGVKKVNSGDITKIEWILIEILLL